MKIGALTRAVMGKCSEGDYKQIKVEMIARVALFVRSTIIPLYERC